MNYSIIRTEEYSRLKKVKFFGTVLDLGGSKTAGYHELISGVEKIITTNIDPKKYDIYLDVEKKFPFADLSVDCVIALNLVSYVFDYENMFKEVSRLIRKDGVFVIAAPFMMHIHGAPEDYYRFTKSFYIKILAKYGFELEQVDELGFGLFSLFFQTIGSAIPTQPFRRVIQTLCVSADKLLLNFRSYRRLRCRIPLGYFIVAHKAV